MEAKAIGRYLRVTPRKARYVLDTVRGKSANEALAVLKFVPNEAARYIERIIESAVANAEHNYAMDKEILRVARAYADGGPVLKRIHPRAMGRAYRILKRTSHITVVLSEDESLRKITTKPKGRRSTKRSTTATAAASTKATPKAPRATKKEKPAPAAVESTESAPETKE